MILFLIYFTFDIIFTDIIKNVENNWETRSNYQFATYMVLNNLKVTLKSTVFTGKKLLPVKENTKYIKI